MTLEQPGCRSMVTSRSKDARMCWTCGHNARIIDNKCACCHQLVRKHEDKEVLAIKLNLDDCISGLKEIEYRFYTPKKVFWVKKSTLDEYIKLKSTDRFERFYHFIKKHRDDGTLTWIRRDL